MQSSGRSFNSGIFIQIATLVAVIVAIVVNAVSNFFPINGLNIGEIANTIFAPVLIIPANYAFAIWGVIYLGIVAFSIYQALPPQRNHPLLQKLRLPLIGASLFQSVWVYQFQSRQFWFSVASMFGILLCLIAAYLQIHSGRNRISRKEKWLVEFPFSIYLGWITVAAIVNVASALFNSGWDGWGISSVAWTVILLVISAAVAVAIALQYNDVAFTSVIVWAIVAIAVRRVNQPAIAIAAIVLAIGLAILIFLKQLKPTKNLR